MPRSVGSAVQLLRFDDDGAGAVSEQHAGRAVVPVEDAGEGLGADDERPLEHAALQIVVGGGEREDEAGAHRLHVEGRAMGDAELGLDGHGGGGKGLVGRRCGEDDQVDVLRRQPGVVERARAASAPIAEVSSPSAAILRSLMPVRSVIQSSEVSTSLARSSLVTTREGR